MTQTWLPADRSRSRRRRVRAYLQLMRFPAVFTALADILLGFLLTHVDLSSTVDFLALLGSSSGLYLGGMVFNDLFDRELDARERPGRPIPSGGISPRAAAILGSALVLLGLVCATLVGTQAIEVSVVLVGLILAYDGFLKTTPLGPVAMGGCRFLNVMLGASAAGNVVWNNPQFVVALAMGVYVAGVTWFARQESERSARPQLVAAAVTSHAGVAGLIAIMWTIRKSDSQSAWLAIAALACVTAWVDIRLFAAMQEPAPRSVQAAVKRMLLAIVLLDATMVFFSTGSPILAACVAALVIPAATLGRWIFIT
jgi:4-hydroxybenzoate polyprenyltransferase